MIISKHRMNSIALSTEDVAKKFDVYLHQIEAALNEILESMSEPHSLYDPIKYCMSARGKRMRPLMTMLSAAMFGQNAESALYAGIAIEIMHNFTLVHDDIMDKSILRRGNPTVYKKWDESTAILCGDAMMGVAYRIIQQHTPPALLPSVMNHFTHGFIEVCEGQAMDIAFGHETMISMEQYFTMIEKKTARLPEIAAVIGAVLGGANDKEVAAVRSFAVEAGIAFQLQDDLLDLIADQAELGKTVGQDIIEGKKTYLIIRCMQKVTEARDKALMQKFLDNRGLLQDEVQDIREMMIRIGVIADMERIIDLHFSCSEAGLANLPNGNAKTELAFLIKSLRSRRK